MKLHFSTLHLFASLLLSLCAHRASAVEKIAVADKPNIIVILADDLGYGSLSCYGATQVRTPQVDRLAREGMRFTDAHSTSAVCGPSRYSLMTGTWPFRNPQFIPQSMWHEGFGLRAHDVTLAEMLRANGYRTGVFGKWHLGIGFDPQPDLNAPIAGTARDAGFDESLTDFANLVPRLYIENGKVPGLDPADPLRWVKGSGKEWSITGGKKALTARKPGCAKIFTERAVRFIADTPAGQPFFLYFPTHAVHVPIVSGSEFAGKSQAGPYGDYLLELDWMVGQIFAELERKGVTEETLIVFSSDNGGAYWQGDSADAFTKHGLRLNGPLLGQKTDLWEGGHRVPLIVRWPGKVRPGTQSAALVSLVDVMATLREALSLRAPAHAGPDSRSFLPTLLSADGTAPARTEAVYTGYVGGGCFALRSGPWAYLPQQRSGGYTGNAVTGGRTLRLKEIGLPNSNFGPDGLLPTAPAAQLYHLDQDLAQSTNVITQHPEVAEKLRHRLAEILATKVDLGPHRTAASSETPAPASALPAKP